MNEILLNMLIRQVKTGNIEVENIKDEVYREVVKAELGIAQ
jgi:hypothetical protein